MKRIALLTVLLLVVGLTAFAIDVKPTLALTGTASVTWGFDLDNSSTGFNNTADASFTLSLLAEDGTDTHAGTGAAYGSITISNIEFFWTDGALTAGMADGDIAAKIVVTPFEIGVYAAPGMTQDFFGAFEDADVEDQVVDQNEAAFGMLGSGFATNFGTWVSGTFGPAVVTLKVVSNDTWVNNLANEYAFGAETVLTFTPLTVSAGAYFGVDMSLYGKVAVDMAPIVAWGAIEANLPTGGTMAFEAGGGLTFTVVADTTLAVAAWFGPASNGLDLNVVFTEPGDKGLVPMLDAAVTFNLLDVADPATVPLTSEWELRTAFGYKVGLNSDATNYARPYLNFVYGSATNGDGLLPANPLGNFAAVPVMNLEAGVQLQVIPLTLFTVKYVSGGVGAVAPGGDLAAATPVLGSIQFVATVTY